MFRAYQVQLSAAGGGSPGGSGQVIISPNVESVEWDIYQLTIQTATFSNACVASVMHNGFFLCNSFAGTKDVATGPPDIVVLPADQLIVAWTGGIPGDMATASIWFNQNPQGTTMSLSH